MLQPLFIGLLAGVMSVCGCAADAERKSQSVREGVVVKVAPRRPTTVPSTEPATGPSRADEARLNAAVDRLFPAEVREGKRQATDREKMAGHFLMVLMAATNGLNDKRSEENQRNSREADQEFETAMRELWSRHNKSSVRLREELNVVEKLKHEQLHVLDFLDRPTTFPTEAAGDEDLLRRIEQLPTHLDHIELLEREIPYHDKRLELLEEMEELKATMAKGADWEGATEAGGG